MCIDFEMKFKKNSKPLSVWTSRGLTLSVNQFFSLFFSRKSTNPPWAFAARQNAEGVLNGNIFSIHKGRDLNDKDLSFFNTEMDVDAFEGHAVYFFGIGMVLWAWVFFEYAD